MSNYSPKAGEQSDRFGNSGRFSSPINDGKSYDFPSRALPHEKSSLPYRKFEFKKDLTPENIRNAFNNTSQNIREKLNDETIKRYGQTFEEWSLEDNNLLTKRGIADKGWDYPGGAIQDMYPIPDDWMSDLDLIEYK